jgi:hypothetical protein
MYGVNRGARKGCDLNNTEQWCCQTDLCNETAKLTSMNWSYLVIIFLLKILFF